MADGKSSLVFSIWRSLRRCAPGPSSGLVAKYSKYFKLFEQNIKWNTSLRSSGSASAGSGASIGATVAVDVDGVAIAVDVDGVAVAVDEVSIAVVDVAVDNDWPAISVDGTAVDDNEPAAAVGGTAASVDDVADVAGAESTEAEAADRCGSMVIGACFLVRWCAFRMTARCVQLTQPRCSPKRLANATASCFSYHRVTARRSPWPKLILPGPCMFSEIFTQ